MPSKPLTTKDLEILKRLVELDTVSYNDLIGELNISREELSFFLKDLMSKGYIEKSDEYLILTDKGRKLFEQMKEKYIYSSR
ncbi:MAG: winged helix-turn-helix domain-containing protein [Sulfolobales archaeon]|nr:winged helix-turn-helix transcriptional regulator [Sulfolobales archaeon]MCX8186928.1 winged helix-turn-helix transcriptional regulator [Sulfolobales archaeon]MDW7970220.1 winged helix-turn-helix domain-containing protein [Sulfolobales archaeon]